MTNSVPLVVALGLLLSACSGTSGDKREIWNTDSVGIAFWLNGGFGGRLCEFSATREDLTIAQLNGLSSLRLQDAAGTVLCEEPVYDIVIQARDGSSAEYAAMMLECASSPILRFEDFDAWAKSTPCSLQP